MGRSEFRRGLATAHLPHALPQRHRLGRIEAGSRRQHQTDLVRLRFMRTRKRQPAAPFPVMFANALSATALVHVSVGEPGLLNLPERPIILMDRAFGGGLTNWLKEVPLGRGLMSPGDMRWLHFADSPEEALPIILEEKKKFLERRAAMGKD